MSTETTRPEDPWALSERLAAELKISIIDVMPMWNLATLFSDAAANYYIWPPAGSRPAILAWLAAHACDWRTHPADQRVIVARGATVQRAFEEATDAR
jgi:hypothetical protein